MKYKYFQNYSDESSNKDSKNKEKEKKVFDNALIDGKEWEVAFDLTENPVISVETICKNLRESKEVVEKEFKKIGAKAVNSYKENDFYTVAANLNKFEFFDWYCDKCESYLNNQSHFPVRGGKCRCDYCGYVNAIDKDNIY